MGFDDSQEEVLKPPSDNDGMTRKEKRLISMILAIGLFLVAVGLLMFVSREKPRSSCFDGLIKEFRIVTNGPSSYQVKFLFYDTTNWLTATNIFDSIEEAQYEIGFGREGVGESLKRGFLDGLKKGLVKDKK